ncbi:MAG: DNA modification methylase [Glaciihabitans sp.]
MRSRVAVSALLAAGVLLGSTGCAFFSPVATQLPYDASDGISATVGDVKVRNAMAITNDGDTVNLVMYVLNSGTEPVEVRFEYDFEGSEPAESDKSEIVELAAGESISFGNDDEENLILTDANAEPGGLMPLFVQYGDETGKTMLVPVLDEAIYSDLVPEPVVTRSPTSTPSSTATPSAPATPSVTATPTPTASPAE